ncbi:hypothetical protein SLNSH_17320 [Alsobacter soli]|uniref:Uncharacterized protein n=1 Tax=Alsobacter soli TaxID=2109933 RepID=A0A2T1HPX7_9HYPH|nr:hypothetical protein [Alsobacter soli]PSC03705.1 hypothetical protein SLNSH_17320 [Alsobacter soli]
MHARSDAGWSGFVRTWALSAAAAIAVVYGLILAVDPYDTGRVPGLGLGRTREQAPRTAHASRARDPQFDAAIIGNSHVQLYSPERLNALTGFHFVSLATPATGVREHKALLGYFLQHRKTPPKAVVIGIDDFDCRSGPGAEHRLQSVPFPFWLYAPDFLTYARGIFRTKAIEDTLATLMGGTRPLTLAGRDGYWDYEGQKLYDERTRARVNRKAKLPLAEQAGPYPGLDVLAAMLDEIPSQTRVALVITPILAAVQPDSASPAGLAEAACKAAIGALARARTNVAALDFRTDTPLTRDAKAFWDDSHITQNTARALEPEIARALGNPGT